MSFYNLEQKGPDGELNIDGVLSVEPTWWMGGEVVARDVRQALAQMKDVTVYINSPGGDVMAGAELYSALKEHSKNGHGRITVKVTGIAASAASVVAMAGDEVLMSPAAYLMIHNPWTEATGNAKELRKQAKVLDEIAEGLINVYQQKTGKSRAQIERMLEGETYMSAQTAVGEGFADGIMWDEDMRVRAEVRRDGAVAGVAAMMRSRDFGRAAALARLRAAEEEPEEEPEEDPEEEKPEDAGVEPEEDPEEDPEEEEPEDADAEPEEEPEEDPEEEPEEEPDEEARAKARQQARAIAAAADALMLTI